MQYFFLQQPLKRPRGCPGLFNSLNGLEDIGTHLVTKLRRKMVCHFHKKKRDSSEYGPIASCGLCELARRIRFFTYSCKRNSSLLPLEDLCIITICTTLMEHHRIPWRQINKLSVPSVIKARIHAELASLIRFQQEIL